VAWKWTRRRLGRDYAKDWAEDANGRPRVLLESSDGAVAFATWSVLRRHGFRTMWCPGPRADVSECPLVGNGHCQLVAECDAVVSALDLHEPRCQAVVAHHNDVATETPVVVVAPWASATRWADELPRCRVVAGPLSREVLLGSLNVSGSTVPVAAPTAPSA
jgi:hypothetical protein